MPGVPGKMITIPHDCPRERQDCVALSNIVADNGESFFCCGENNGENRPVEQDKYTVCFKGAHRDEMSYNDKRDLIHNSAVIVRALAVIERPHCEENSKDWSPWEDV